MLKALIRSVIRRVFRQILALCLLVTAVALVGADWLNREIFSPPRRALQTYHLERLQNPAAYGLQIRTYGCLENKVPCLLVEPDAQAGPGQRGTILRRQLTNLGVMPPAYGKVRGTIVLLHGRNERKEDMLPVAERFAAAGFRCLIPDLPGHGDSPLPAMAFGSSAFERGLPRRILEDARDHFHLPPEPAVLWGMSMGGAFAVSAASESPDDWAALMIVSSFADLDEVMELQVPPRWRNASAALLPFMDVAQWLHGAPGVDAMQPGQWAQHATMPALVVHGDRDRFIPLDQGQLLYTSLASQDKRWITVPGGGHNNVLATSMPLYAEMSAWLLQTLPTQTLAER